MSTSKHIQTTNEIIREIFLAHGFKIPEGLGDWRPGGKTPGSFGMFEAAVKEI